uniref:Uncharacterized protein n=1 Tax=Cucumis melo TaxID=3656 RepID=A0A9I9D4E2_CUCME
MIITITFIRRRQTHGIEGQKKKCKIMFTNEREDMMTTKKTNSSFNQKVEVAEAFVLRSNLRESTWVDPIGIYP